MAALVTAQTENLDLQISRLRAIQDVVADLRADDDILAGQRTAICGAIDDVLEGLNRERANLVFMFEPDPNVPGADDQHYPTFEDYRLHEGMDVFEVENTDQLVLPKRKWRILPDPSGEEDWWMLLVMDDGIVVTSTSITGDALGELDLIAATYETRRPADG